MTDEEEDACVSYEEEDTCVSDDVTDEDRFSFASFAALPREGEGCGV